MENLETPLLVCNQTRQTDYSIIGYLPKQNLLMLIKSEENDLMIKTAIQIKPDRLEWYLLQTSF